MQRLSGLLFLVLILAGLALAPLGALAAPDMNHAVSASDVHMHEHRHGQASAKDHCDEMPMDTQHRKAMINCMAWCAGAFLTALPAAAWLSAPLPPNHDQPSPSAPLIGREPMPPFEPPQSPLS